MAEDVDQAPLDRLAHHVLPAAGLLVNQVPVQAEDIGEQAFGEPVLTHHPGRDVAAVRGELDTAVIGDGEQPVTLHPGHRLRHRGHALP